MQLSTRGRYAVMALVDLAMQQGQTAACGPICLGDIAQRQQLSLSYLEQLFAKLRRAGLVSSARGPGGGYRLARPADEIAIADIVGAVDEALRTTRCEAGSGGCMTAADSPACGRKVPDPRPVGRTGRQIALFLGGLTLADVVEGRVCGAGGQPAGPGGGLRWSTSTPMHAAVAPGRRRSRAGGVRHHRQSVLVHGAGRAARRIMEDARERIAGCFGARPQDLVFTSGGTEADALAIHALSRGRRTLISVVEHDAVRFARVRGACRAGGAGRRGRSGGAGGTIGRRLRPRWSV